MKKRNSLILRIALPLAVILAVTMAVLTVFLTSFLQNTYLEILRGSLQSETRLVADQMAALMAQNPGTAAIEQQAFEYANLLDARVTIIDTDGVVLADSSVPAAEMENHSDRPEVLQALQNLPNAEIRYSDTVQTDMLYTAAPILDGSEVIGAARLAVSLRVIQRNQAALQRTLLIATGAATLAAVVTGLLLAWYTLYPLKKLTETAQRVADGQVDDIPSSSRNDEIGQLNQSIQAMAQHLKAQIDDIREERAKLEVVLSNMTDGLIIVDPLGKVRLMNTAAQQLFQTGEGQAMGRSLIEVVRHHQLVDLWQECYRSGEQQTTTLETAPDRLFVHGIATPLKDAPPGMTLLVFQDLTRVRKLETVRRDFVSNVSHELRTPLASLKALTETLQEGALEDPPAARRFLKRMETEIDNLTQMVRELLELSRIESGRIPLNRKPIDPCALAAPAVERLQVQAERAGLRLGMDCPGARPRVLADAERIEQVLVNLIHNAIKFTPPGGSIDLSAEQVADKVVFSVRDSGVGIPAEVLPRIFERFYKVDQARTGGGTGLGLSIARHIVDAHGGLIWAESKEKAGSTFSFSLPLA